MQLLVYLFGSGLIFFIAIGLVFAAAALFALASRSPLRVMATLLAAVGLILAGLSATPLPMWFYAAALAITVSWLASERVDRNSWNDKRPWLRGAAAVIWAGAAAAELPFHFMPEIPALGNPSLHIIGDSVAAGMGGPESTWPTILAGSYGIDVADHSQMGATARTARRQAAGLPQKGGLVIVVIGGNDLINDMPEAEFEADMDGLLTDCRRRGRTILMLELPLPPFASSFGAVQRRMASKHGVLLIPKRFLMSQLTGTDATHDSVHLTQEGHRRMAIAVWELIRPAYD
jgi:acyl-CoA thioesterase-1